MLQSHWIVDKTEVRAKNGLVVTKDLLASEAGLAMLRRGGNVVDAAVAAAFAVGVVEPNMSGIGGGGFMLLYLARERRTVVIDYAMRGPLATYDGMFELEQGYTTDIFGWRKVKGDANIHGHKSVAVPGVVAGLCHAQQHFGTLPLSEVMAPAIRLAREGFPVTWVSQLAISGDAQTLSRYPETARTFFRNGLPKAITASSTDRIVQPDLALTLEAIAADGPDAFYRGTVAAAIERAILAGGGLLTAEDLARYQVRVMEPPPAVGFGGDQVFSSPCPSGGTTLQETLAILAGTGVAEAGHNSAEALHLIAEASRLAWADRFAHLCDSDLLSFDWRLLFSPDYAASRRELIHRERAMSTVPVGNPQALRRSPPAGPLGADGSTTALATADGEGNLVAITQTLMSSFGSRVTVPGTGVLLNNGMYWFDPEPGKPNSVGPGKKPLNNMAPLLVLRDGKPFLAVSSSGGRHIPGANLNIYLNAAVYGMGMQAAVAAPRVDLSGGFISADDRIAPAALEALRRRGHRVETEQEIFRPRPFASPTCIRIDPESGLLCSGTDPWGGAAALGL